MKKQLRVLIGDTGDTLAAVIAHDLQRNSVWTVIRAQTDKALLESVRRDHPDVVLLNLTQVTVDFANLTEQMRALSDLHIVALYRRENLYLEAMLREQNVICWRIPADVRALREALMRAFRPLCGQYHLEAPAEVSALTLEIDVTNLLHASNIPVNLMGFHYLRTAISIVYREPERLYSPFQELYADIAAQHQTTAARIERCIRNAITQSFSVRPQESAYSPVQFLQGRNHMTNSEFIAAAADWLHICQVQRNTL